MAISQVPLRGLSVTVKLRMLALNWPTVSRMRPLALSSSTTILSPTWKVPLDGVSAHFTFWIRYGYSSSSLAALGQVIR